MVDSDVMVNISSDITQEDNVTAFIEITLGRFHVQNLCAVTFYFNLLYRSPSHFLLVSPPFPIYVYLCKVFGVLSIVYRVTLYICTNSATISIYSKHFFLMFKSRSHE